MKRRTGDKRRRISEAAVRVFARDGFHGALISRIAEEAGVAAGSVYLYFPGKEAILQELFSQLWKALHEMFEGVVGDSELDAGEKIEALIDGVFTLFSKNPDLAQVFVNEQHHLVRDGEGGFMAFYEEFLTMGENVFREGVKSGLFRQDLKPRVCTHVVLGSFRQLLKQWAMAPRRFPLRTLQVDLKGIVMRGIRA